MTLPIIATALLSLAACGGSDPSTTSSSATVSSATASSATSSASSSATESPTSTAGSSSGSASSPSAPSAPSPPAAPSPDESADPTDPSTSDTAAGITNLKWRYLDPPATWKPLETEGGNLQWQIEGTTCAFTLSQLNGLTAKGDPPTNSEVVENFVQQLTIGAFSDAAVEPIATDTRAFRATIDGDPSDDVEFTGAKVSWPSIPATAQVYAYTNGDFANVVYAVCGGDVFDQYWASDFDPYLDSLVADIAG